MLPREDRRHSGPPFHRRHIQGLNVGLASCRDAPNVVAHLGGLHGKRAALFLFGDVMGLSTAPERPSAPVGEVNGFSASFVGKLDSGELLTGTPTVVEVTSTDLTITNKVVNSVALTINNKTVAIGNAVQFKVTGHLLATLNYTIKITVVTDSSPARTKIGYFKFKVEA